MNGNLVCFIRLELKSCTLYVFNVYFPCDTNNNEYLQEYNDVLSDISSCMIKHNIDYCIIAGDLNTDLSRVNSGNTLRYATISSIKKMREIIHFEIFMDWCAILFILSIYITDIIQRTLFISQNYV